MGIYLPEEREVQQKIFKDGRKKDGCGRWGLIGLEVAVVVETAINATKPQELRIQKSEELQVRLKSWLRVE